MGNFGPALQRTLTMSGDIFVCHTEGQRDMPYWHLEDRGQGSATLPTITQRIAPTTKNYPK